MTNGFGSHLYNSLRILGAIPIDRSIFPLQADADPLGFVNYTNAVEWIKVARKSEIARL